MTSTSSLTNSGTKPRATVWRNRALGLLAVIIVLVVAYFVLSAFIPRWWAQRIAGMSGHGSFAQGIWSGLAIGFLCTLIPLLLLLGAVRVWRTRAGKFAAGAAAVLALIVALPNLMTLTIVLGGNSAAHAGERVLDVDAPGFRGASLVGAIVAAAIFVVLFVLLLRKQWRARSARRAEAGMVTAPDTANDTRPPGDIRE